MRLYNQRITYGRKQVDDLLSARENQFLDRWLGAVFP
jgi:hypothetical protein